MGTEYTPGGGYIPPQSALAANSLSALASGATIATGLPALVLALSMAADGSGYPAGAVAGAAAGRLENVGLAALLLLAATAFAGLALLLTALSGRTEGFQLKTPLARLQAYGALTFLGLVADGSALALLARGDLAGFRCAAIAGTVLMILALLAGIWGRMPPAGSRAKAG